MPRPASTARSRVDRIPGLYEHIRGKWQREVERGDPRLVLEPDLTDAERDAFNEVSPSVRQARRMVAKMTRGETIVIASWELGHEFRQHQRRIGWLADPFAPCDLTVAADDIVTPVD
jgi:hypothetical protein